MAEHFADAVASSVGGVITVGVTYPIEIVKNRMASSTSNCTGKSSQPLSAFDVSRDIYSRSGIPGFFDGLSVSAGENALEKFLYFYVYSGLRTYLQRLRGGSSIFVDLVAGSLSELAHLPLTVPLDTLLIKIINNPKKSVSDIVSDMLSENGLRGIYAGVVPSIILCMKPALQLAMFEAMKSRLLRSRRARSMTLLDGAALSVGEAFFTGALARALATIMVFPYMRAKFALKAGLGAASRSSGSDNAVVGLHRAMLWVVRQQGFKGLYVGLYQELVRATMSAALLMAIRERLTLVITKSLTGLK
eukprot:TRINITY_DN16873_c0_g1_i1.p1 TRINITY_DN16873_c0_g1~~TRINITY_DN16873_c0_g1_i1.p1  ORF type:complete len:304 (+),score=41.87 TRINITY_DN16873_c0_g1_i1:45-956(+)